MYFMLFLSPLQLHFSANKPKMANIRYFKILIFSGRPKATIWLPFKSLKLLTSANLFLHLVTVGIREGLCHL